MQTIVTRKGRTCQSPFSNSEAIDQLVNLTRAGQPLARSNFACELAARRKLSDEQVKWAHILVVEALAPKPAPTPVADANGNTLDCSKVVALFDNAAASKLRWPAITLQIGDVILKLARAGERSKFPGTINVNNGQKFGSPDNVWYGRITRDGVFEPSRAFTSSVHSTVVVDAMTRMAADPIATTVEIGQKSGNCCFCFHGLSDDTAGRSLEVGYGPTCAKRWGLPWGKAAKAA